MKEILKIGTRGSKLALWQANRVKELLEKAGQKSELVLYKSEGDISQLKPLREIGVPGLFTKVLDDAILNEEIDIAVHSAKDMTSEPPSGLSLIALLKREDPRDVMLSLDKNIDLDNQNLTPIIGTSSIRRQSLLKHYAPNVKVKNIRGNVDTRIAKMKSGEYDGIILAYAGVKRMGMTEYIVRKLNVSTFTPAAGQGAIAIVSKAGFGQTEFLRKVLNHSSTELEVICERAFLKTIDGGCTVPAFALAVVVGDTLTFSAGIAETDGSKITRAKKEGPITEAFNIGEAVGQNILTQMTRINSL